MSRVRVRVTAATGLVSGGLLFAIWSVSGLSITRINPPLTEHVFLLSYVGLVVGFGSLCLLARRTDDAISPAVTPVAVGVVLLAPVVVIQVLGPASVPLVSTVPFETVLEAALFVGVLATVFGVAILGGTFIPRPSPSDLVEQPWGRAFVGLLCLGTFGWALSYPLYESPGFAPVAFPGLVTPYTRTVGAADEVVTGAFVVFALAFCLLGMALLSDRTRPSARADRQRT